MKTLILVPLAVVSVILLPIFLTYAVSYVTSNVIVLGIVALFTYAFAVNALFTGISEGWF